MRKLATGIFAVLYVVLILMGSAERTNVWVTRQAEATSHSNGFSRTEKSPNYLYQTRLIENHFVVELPREAADISLSSERYTPLSLYEDHIAPGGQQVSSRAPPALA